MAGGSISDAEFEGLVREHHAGLYRFALSLTRNEADAVDLVQETFLRWAEKGHQLVDRTRGKSWLFTTLYREATGRLRRMVRFPHEPLEGLEAELPEVESPAPAAADAPLVLQALGQVDEAYRGAITLFYLEDYSYPEIAALLEVPLGTVKSRIARGLAQLQRLLRSPARQPMPARTP